MGVHLWVRAEERANEARVPITPEGVRQLVAAGFTLTVEESNHRCLPIGDFAAAGAVIAPPASWKGAARDTFILGIKELPEDGTPLVHRHIFFGHAYKGQPAGQVLLGRLKQGGGTLLDMEYLVDEAGRRLAAFGVYAGFAGAGVALAALLAQRRGETAGPVETMGQSRMVDALRRDLQANGPVPRVLIIGALGRVGRGAADLCTKLEIAPTLWDIEQTKSGGPFPEVLEHDIFLNCILAMPGCPVFLTRADLTKPRALRVVGDIACDPTSPFNPVAVYDRVTTWQSPALRVAENPVLDVVAIDNLPSLLPIESSLDFAAQLLPLLSDLAHDRQGVWARAEARFHTHLNEVSP